MMRRLNLLGAAALICLSGLLLAEDDDMVLADRIDFSSARIMGQANDFGAVYLMHRKKNEMNSLLSIRSNYRREVLFELEFQPLDDKSGELILPSAFGDANYESGFEPVVIGGE